MALKFKDKTMRRKDKRSLKQALGGAVYVPTEEIRTPEQRVAKPIKPLRPLNEAQSNYINSIKANIITFGVGPAGVGKTYIAAAYAANLLKEGEIDTLIITRPGVEAGRNWGALPGELEEKFAPFMEPFIDVLNERLGKSHVEYLIKRGSIQAKPLEFMRGKSFNNCFCILDEAQNTTPAQMKLFLTRTGENSKIIVDGDLEQKDINGMSGLLDATNKLWHVNNIGIVRFTLDDCVRGSGIVKDILRAYEGNK